MAKIIAVDCGKSTTKTVVFDGGVLTKDHFSTAIGYAKDTCYY